MKFHRAAGALFVCLLTACAATIALAGAQPSTAPDAADAPLFRVFLKDGSSLVSFGELARVDDRVVFSMPTSASASAPQLQLINIPADRVDWERTVTYAESVRSTRYLATRAAADYALLTNEIAKALNDIGPADNAPRRLAVVEKARKALADWPAAHYNYKRDEIQQMVGALDEAIASLRVEAGSNTFDLSFVAAALPPPVLNTILPAPSPQETIEQTVRAAQLTTSAAERMSLLTVARSALDADALPAEWASSMRTEVTRQIAREMATDRRYRVMGARMLKLATDRAQVADVRGVQHVILSIKANDERLGSSRPDAVASMIAAVEEQLDAARRLRLELDRWALRAPELRAYRAAIASSLDQLRRMTPLLEDIKALAGSGPDALGFILRESAQIRKVMATLDPPTELTEVHNLLASAVQLADNAARIRREAALTGNLARAWDASSAAAGALMLSTRARTDMGVALRPPQISRLR
ncbi:MAG TPA: hypothetical protein VM032_19130 [Vicinamibacterales bacterium]|nr:hypothetical protein [Vicinamibacterales bacterium]